MLKWGVFRLKGIFNRKTVKARRVDDEHYAVEERQTTDKLRKSLKQKPSKLLENDSSTCVTQTIISDAEFKQYFAPVDAVAKSMV